ncbi:Lrp/AsnC family transcriptional regulator [Clostridium intestinale]|jgi:Lrp/AsnC family leucine-responsive transcriptional regulator|uniref:Lrp/AsnC family transcriptional regulator n=1 Tax=Clostridium intestinale TaxID=36845 RepID=UPI002DD63799|nr:Lrp/AsnC family transcriptional regulator [Clostridium intestinale]WRY52300.1 Lrp/AsnC family transcriptional regulator [Clostridium intestinale]
MDEIDLKLIKLLQENARYSLKYLAKEVFLSTPAVSSRILKLEESGIIKGYSAQVNLPKLNYNIKAFINLEVSPKQKPEFYPFIAACPNVLECNCVTGKFSMLIKVSFHTTEELDGFINEIQRFGNTETQIVFSTPVDHRGIQIEMN